MSNKYNFKAIITGFMSGKEGEPKVKVHTFPANDRGPARQVAQVTINVKTDAGSKYIRASFPIAQSDYLNAVPETARISAEGWLVITSGKEGKEWWNLENAQFLGAIYKGEASKAEKPTKAKPVKSKPAPAEDDEEDDEDAPARAEDDDEEGF